MNADAPPIAADFSREELDGLSSRIIGAAFRVSSTLGHGFRVDARVAIAEHADVLRVPTDALVRDGRGWAVFVFEGGRARLTPTAIGAGGENYRAVAQGLELGQRVVLFPGDSLADGAK